MNEKTELKNHLIKIGVLVAAIVLLGVSLTYSYYSANKKGTGNVDETSAGRLDVTSTLTTAPAISNTNLQLIDATNVSSSAEKVEFSVTSANTSTVNGKYFVYLTNLKLSKNLYSKYFKWQLVRKTSSGESEIAKGTFASAVRSDEVVPGEAAKVLTTAEDITLNSTVLTIAPNSQDNLVFRLWLENDNAINQVSLTEGQFSGKLKIEVAPSH